MKKTEQHIEKVPLGCLEGGLCFFIVFVLLYYPIQQINTAKLKAGTPPGERLDSSFEFVMNIETFFHDIIVSGIVLMIIVFLVTKWKEGKPYRKSKYPLEVYDDTKDEILDDDL